MTINWQGNLVAYGTQLLRHQLGQPQPATVDTTPGTLAAQGLATDYSQDEALNLARDIIGDTVDLAATTVNNSESLTSVFDLIEAPPGQGPIEASAFPFQALTLPHNIENGEAPGDTAENLWSAFWQTLNQLSDQSPFETFFYTVARFGWYVPGNLSDPHRPGFSNGISVFEQFKAVAALSRCLKPALDQQQPISLIAGDLPGIQKALYTITTKAAAKMLRGHSIYLQLLGDALIRRVLQRFDLTWANVIYSAGGNFLLVAPDISEGEIETLSDDLNKTLLDIHRGEQFLALATISMPAQLYADKPSTGSSDDLARQRTRLHHRLDQAKHAAFQRIVSQRYQTVFNPLGDGGPVSSGPAGNLCEISHVELDEQTRMSVIDEDGTALLLSEQFHSFAFPNVAPDDRRYRYDSLAWSLYRAHSLVIKPLAETERPTLAKYQQGKGRPPWNIALQAIGFDYRFIWSDTYRLPQAAGGIYLAFDPANFLPVDIPDPSCAYGFRFLSRLTPYQQQAETEGTGAEHASSNGMEQRSIRDFHTMAQDDATGVNRYGVLRMDIDEMGLILGGYRNRYADLLHLSALSAQLDYFFGARLDQICHTEAIAWRNKAKPWTAPRKLKQATPPLDQQKLPYVIYAGGDDLFIVGPWDLLPPLAQAIRSGFVDFSLNRLSMSGGIAIARQKYPLYKTAEQAGQALEQAKDREVINQAQIIGQKNALTFLGVTLNWDDMATAQSLVEELADLLAGANDEQAPRALLQFLGYIARLYQREAESLAESDPITLGRWLPALHYGLRRIKRRSPGSIRAKIANIPKNLLNLNQVYEAGKTDNPSQLTYAVQHYMEQSRQEWPAIRYLDLVVRWAEYLTRRENRYG